MAVIKLPKRELDCGCVYFGVSNSYSLCKEHGPIVKGGEDRSRAGQRNRQEVSTPFKLKRDIHPHHEMTRRVAEYTTAIDITLFQYMREGLRLEWDNLKEVKELALEQIKDDAGFQYTRIGRNIVDSVDMETFQEEDELWPALTPDQEAVSEAMSTFLEKLTLKQNEVVRLRYFERCTQAEAAKRLNQTTNTIKVDEKNAKAKLTKLFMEAFPAEEEDVDAEDV